MDIGINYITELDKPENRYDNIYKILVKKGYINTLKFPGKFCNYETLDQFLKLAKETNVNIDVHGIPKMVPAIHSKNFIKNVEWEKIIPQIGYSQRISTHMGMENKEKISNYEEGTIEENIRKVKEKLDCEIGIENIPGGFEFDKQTLTPDFITETWGIADFGVFDISHAKLAAQDLNMTYSEYLKQIKHKEKVKILHISGNINETHKYSNKPDKHILINKEEIKDIIDLLNEFENLELIISEYAYNTKYSYEKELIIEAIILNMIVNTKNEKIVKEKLKYLEDNLKDDISNLEIILQEGE